jgi:hypothetical protein
VTHEELDYDVHCNAQIGEGDLAVRIVGGYEMLTGKARSCPFHCCEFPLTFTTAVG